MKKKQPYPHRIQTMVGSETFEAINRTRRQEDTSQSEVVRYYIELGINAEQQAAKIATEKGD